VDALISSQRRWISRFGLVDAWVGVAQHLPLVIGVGMHAPGAGPVFGQLEHQGVHLRQGFNFVFLVSVSVNDCRVNSLNNPV